MNRIICTLKYSLSLYIYTHIYIHFIKYTLAGDVSGLFVYDTRSPSAAKTSVHLTFWPLVAGGTHTLHMSRAGQRAAFGVHAIMVTNICDQTERKPIIMTNLNVC